MVEDRNIWKTTYYGGKGPATMARSTIVFYYGQDEANTAKEIAKVARSQGHTAYLREALSFTGEIERCDRVIVLEKVDGGSRGKIIAAYMGLVEPARGSDKWDGGVIIGGKVEETVEEAKAAGRYHEFKHEVTKQDPRQTAEQTAHPDRPARAAEPTVQEPPAALKQAIDEREATGVVTVQPTSQVVTGPKGNPEEVSLKMGETNLRPKFDDPTVAAPPAKSRRGGSRKGRKKATMISSEV